MQNKKLFWLSARILFLVLPVFEMAAGNLPARAQDNSATSNSAKTANDADPSVSVATDGQQPKRILGIIPNYRSVSADTQLPPLSAHQKFGLATEDSFDYSSFMLSGFIAGVNQIRRADPEFKQGIGAYGRYYWHAFADQTMGNYLSEAIVPSLTHEDPRYYTLGHGNALRRTEYAISRLVVTRSDSPGNQFNISEIGGNAAGAALAALYYPANERNWTKIQQRWLTQISVDGFFNICKEFWPDIARHLPLHHNSE